MIPARTGGEGACQDTGAQPVQQEAHGEWHRAQGCGALGLLPNTGFTSLLSLTQLSGAPVAKSGMLHTDLVAAQGGMLHKKSQSLPRNIPKLLPARPRFSC